MNAAVEVVVQVVLLIVFVWVAVMGGMGALIARARGGSPLEGFLWGTVFGPFGWIAIAVRTRAGSGTVSAAEWLQASPSGGGSGTDALDDLIHGT